MPRFHEYRPHPWHGLSIGPQPPARVHVFVEITPFSTVKFEVDKDSGYLKVDRPQATSSLPPGAYGFVPRTFCGSRVAALAGTPRGDGDPLDICVISERPIPQGDILLTARVVGGLLLIDKGEADDKIIAVLDRDPLWSGVHDLETLPVGMVNRWRHYFQTYKLDPDGGQPVEVRRGYGAAHARAVLEAAIEDYREGFGD